MLLHCTFLSILYDVNGILFIRASNGKYLLMHQWPKIFGRVFNFCQSGYKLVLHLHETWLLQDKSRVESM